MGSDLIKRGLFLLCGLIFVLNSLSLESLPVAIFKYQASRKLERKEANLIAAAVYRQLGQIIGRENVLNRAGEILAAGTQYFMGTAACSHAVTFFIYEYRGRIIIEFQIFRLRSGRVAARPERLLLELTSLRSLEFEVADKIRKDILPRVRE